MWKVAVKMVSVWRACRMWVSCWCMLNSLTSTSGYTRLSCVPHTLCCDASRLLDSRCFSLDPLPPAVISAAMRFTSALPLTWQRHTGVTGLGLCAQISTSQSRVMFKNWISVIFKYFFSENEHTLINSFGSSLSHGDMVINKQSHSLVMSSSLILVLLSGFVEIVLSAKLLC